MSATQLKQCLLCDSRNLELGLRLSDLPVADAYRRSPGPEVLYPVELRLCQDCGHAQLGHVVDRGEMWDEYLFHSADNPWYLNHLAREAQQIVSRFNPRKVLEIGSNDGALLNELKKLGVRTVVGVEPSNVKTEYGIETIRGYFTGALASEIAACYGEFDCVIANHVFAHTPEMHDMADGIRRVLSHDGVFVFENAYLMDLVEGTQYDQIYHEHISYHSLRPLLVFFVRHGLELFDAERNGAKGGSIRGFVQPLMGQREIVWERTRNLLLAERFAELNKPERYAPIARRIERHWEMIPENGELVGYGASSSCTCVIYNLGLGGRLKFLIDDNPRRHGLYSPGANLEVRAPQSLNGEATVILALRYAGEIVPKLGGDVPKLGTGCSAVIRLP